MVIGIQPECEDTLRSKSQINLIGASLVDSPIPTNSLLGAKCFRMYRLAVLDKCLDKVIAAEPPKNSLVSARLKRLISIRRKIVRSIEGGHRTNLSRIDDIIGIRVICGQYYEALEFSSKMEEIGTRVKNYVECPQDSGYRAIHHIFSIDQPNVTDTQQSMRFTFEVQIRTFHQHQWSIWSESCGEQAKENRARETVKRKLINLSKRIKEWEEGNETVRQGDLPEMSDSHNFALLQRFDRLSTSMHIYPASAWEQALQFLFYIEDSNAMEPDVLLLAGIGNKSNLDEILNCTHPTFFRTVEVPSKLDKSLNPIY